MKILLLGADGQLGAHLRRTLPSVGNIVPVTRQGNGGALRCDLADLAELDALLHRERPDLVVNAAAYTAVDQAETDVEAATRINADVPGIVGTAVAQWNGAVIHYSTDYVFDGLATRPYTEADATRPLGVYGQSKLEGERALAATGVDHIILRTAWVYSLRGRNFLTTMLRLAAERSELRIVDDQRGTPTSASFLAEASATIASRWMAVAIGRQHCNGIYHLTAAGETTWYGFALELFAQAAANGAIGISPTVTPILTSDFPTRARRPAYSVLAHMKIKEVFGIDPPVWSNELHRVMNVGNGS